MKFKRKPKPDQEETFTDEEIQDMISNQGSHRQVCESLREERDKVVSELLLDTEALKDRLRNGAYENDEDRKLDLKLYQRLKTQVKTLERETSIRTNPTI